MAVSMFFAFWPLSMLPFAVFGLILTLYSLYYGLTFPAYLVQTGAIVFGVVAVLQLLIVGIASSRYTRPLTRLVKANELFLEGQWEQRAPVQRRDERGKLAFLFNKMADEMTGLYQTIATREAKEREHKTHPLENLARVLNASTNLTDLLQNSLRFIVKYYSLDCAAVYLVDKTDQAGSNYVILQQIATPEAKDTQLLRNRFLEKIVKVDPASQSDWLISKVIFSKRPQVDTFTDEIEASEASKLQSLIEGIESAEQNDATYRTLPKPPEDKAKSSERLVTLFEAAIPMTINERVVGVLDLYTRGVEQHTPEGPTRSNPFTPGLVSVLQALADVLALATAIFAKAEAPGESRPQMQTKEAELLYQASYQITQSETTDEVIQSAANSFKQIAYASALLLVHDGKLKTAFQWRMGSKAELSQYAYRSKDPNESTEHPTIPLETITPYLKSATERSLGDFRSRPILISDVANSQLPKELLALPRRLGCEASAFLPASRGDKLVAILMLGGANPLRSAERPGEQGGKQVDSTMLPSSLAALQPFIIFIELVAATLERIQAQQGTHRRLAELQTLWGISQAIAMETELKPLYQIIQKQIEGVTGKLDSFAIALYEADKNQVHIPYMVEEGQAIDVAPFPLGDGLTSLVIRTGRPLMLVEETERQAFELGAKTIGTPAQSWLGVPMIIGGEVIGVIIAQDTHREHRFSEEDQRLLSTLAAQVAVVVRNAWLLESTRQQAQQEKLLNEISDKIRRSVDIETILKTTAEELGRALGAERASIEIQVEPLGGNGREAPAESEQAMLAASEVEET
jgi:GAF domain-containing protein/HAMP domain-containing protein